MEKAKLIDALSQSIPRQLVCELVDEFLALRHDVVTGTLGRSAPGKFVETFVQILQFLERGKYEPSPRVDEYLRGLESRSTPHDDGLRICAARVARAMYALRSKRNIVHKNQIDPNIYDLRFLHSAAQWILAELIRTVGVVSMQEAGNLAEQVQLPVGGLIEDFGRHRLVLEDLSTRDELLVLLHSYYPKFIMIEQIVDSLDRRPKKTVQKVLHDLWKEKMVDGSRVQGYKLTKKGFHEAVKVIRSCLESESET